MSPHFSSCTISLPHPAAPPPFSDWRSPTNSICFPVDSLMLQAEKLTVTTFWRLELSLCHNRCCLRRGEATAVNIGGELDEHHWQSSADSAVKEGDPREWEGQQEQDSASCSLHSPQSQSQANSDQSGVSIPFASPQSCLSRWLGSHRNVRCFFF